MRTRALVAAVVLGAASVAGCSDGGDDTEAMLAAIADEVIIPSYDALVTAVDDLSTELDDLCADPSAAALEDARAAWRDVAVAWEHTRAGGVGPAMDRRLAASIGFVGRPEAVDELLATTDPVDVGALREAGAAVKGIAAIEEALFAAGSDELAERDGQRRCTYLQSVTSLAGESAEEVLADWTGGYRDTFVDGMDGDSQASVDLLVNEVIFRVTEVDDQGLRALVEAAGPDDLRQNRADGAAAFHLAELRSNLEGVAAIVDDEPDAPRLLDLVRDRSPATADRLDAALADAVAAMEPLPDSVTESFDDPAAVAAAQAAVQELKVLLGTEVASQLGVTISFSDADGDS